MRARLLLQYRRVSPSSSSFALLRSVVRTPLSYYSRQSTALAAAAAAGCCCCATKAEKCISKRYAVINGGSSECTAATAQSFVRQGINVEIELPHLTTPQSSSPTPPPPPSMWRWWRRRWRNSAAAAPVMDRWKRQLITRAVLCRRRRRRASVSSLMRPHKSRENGREIEV